MDKIRLTGNKNNNSSNSSNNNNGQAKLLLSGAIGLAGLFLVAPYSLLTPIVFAAANTSCTLALIYIHPRTSVHLSFPPYFRYFSHAVEDDRGGATED